MAAASYYNYCPSTTLTLNEHRLTPAPSSLTRRKNPTPSPPLSIASSPIFQTQPQPLFNNDCVLRARLNDSSESQVLHTPSVLTSVWKWRGYSIRYQHSGADGPALVLIHGFGANSEHWRKNIPDLARSHRVYAIDLIGYGYSDKPNPRQFGDTSFYTFDTWASQINDFCSEVVKNEAFFICNSIGGVVGLQAAVWKPHLCKGVMLINISLRMLHIKKQPWFGRPFIRTFQNLLKNTDVGKLFYKGVATPESVKNILSQCYYDTSQVTDELVRIILEPGLQPGAVDVFLDFICYSDGPLPEELLPQVKVCHLNNLWNSLLPLVDHFLASQCPVMIAWGDRDPWEPVELGKACADFDSVEEFVVLPDVGHCPQDESPHLVNPLVEAFVARHTANAVSSEVPL